MSAPASFSNSSGTSPVGRSTTIEFKKPVRTNLKGRAEIAFVISVNDILGENTAATSSPFRLGANAKKANNRKLANIIPPAMISARLSSFESELFITPPVLWIVA